jgi:RHS repeat-associated protein
MYYDGPGRLVRTELPDGSFSCVAFSPWHVESFDPNDTVLASAWYQARTPVNPADAAPTAPDKRAAWLAARCNNTPAVTTLDTLGREVIALAHNRVEDPAGTLTFDRRTWKDERYITFAKLDIEGKPLWIRDALGHLVMQHVTPPRSTAAADDSVPAASVPGYDIAGNLLFQHSMDAGDRWMLTDAAGKPMLAWDFNEATPATPGAPLERRLYFTAYDELHRTTALWLRCDNDPPIQVERFEYQDAQPNDTNNLNRQAVRHYDPSGLVETLKRDFKGNVENARRTLTAAGRASVVDWRTLRNPNGSLKLNNEPFTQFTEYDALSRISLHYNWHRVATRVAVYRPTYGERGILTSENLLIGAARTPNGPTGGVNAGGPDAIQEIRYNVKGQKELVKLGNGTTTTYEYDPTTFRLMRILTRRRRPAGDTCSSAFNSASVIQDLQYTYDPVGNITQIVDAAQATRFGANQRIDSIHRYEYDPLYRLTSATGKENGATSGAPTNVEGKAPEAPCPAPDPAALRNYTQRYGYDPVGNIKRMRHVAGAVGSWTRDYSYAYEVTGAPPSNCLATTTGGAGVVTTFRHDTHGNMLNLANAPAQFDLQWDHRDMIRQIDLGGGGNAYYQYDAGKQRTRKRIENQNGLGGYWERIDLGGYELYRRYNRAGTHPIEEIETHHLLESDQRVLIVDDVITAGTQARPRPDGLTVQKRTLFRYQYTNHLSSSCLELDGSGSIISYEECHPYGTSAFRATKRAVEAPPKRYRYTGMERDEESGLHCNGVRYLAPWICRWISGAGHSARDGSCCYAYVRDNPIVFHDRTGTYAAGPEPPVITNPKAPPVEGPPIVEILIFLYLIVVGWHDVQQNWQRRTEEKASKLDLSRQQQREQFLRELRERGERQREAENLLADGSITQEQADAYVHTGYLEITNPLARINVEKEYLRLKGVKSVGSLTFKEYWNLQELLADAAIMRSLNVVSFGQVELFEVTKGGKVIKLGRIADNLVLAPATGKTAIIEYSTKKEFLSGKRKAPQLRPQLEAFARAQAGKSVIIARFKGGGVLEVSNAAQMLQTYPHWDPREDISKLAKELGLEDPYKALKEKEAAESPKEKASNTPIPAPDKETKKSIP